MRTTSLFLICLLAMTNMAVDISDIDELNLLAMDSSDAFEDVMTLLNQLEAQSQGELVQIEDDWVTQGGALQEVCTEQTRLYNEKTGEVDG